MLLICGFITQSLQVLMQLHPKFNFFNLIMHYSIVFHIIACGLYDFYSVSCLHVVDAFVNSQEWTVSRRLHDIRLVIHYIFIVVFGMSKFFLSIFIADIVYVLF